MTCNTGGLNCSLRGGGNCGPCPLKAAGSLSKTQPNPSYGLTLPKAQGPGPVPRCPIGDSLCLSSFWLTLPNPYLILISPSTSGSCPRGWDGDPAPSQPLPLSWGSELFWDTLWCSHVAPNGRPFPFLLFVYRGNRLHKLIHLRIHSLSPNLCRACSVLGII